MEGPSRSELIQTLFTLLDEDGDGLLKQDETFNMALACGVECSFEEWAPEGHEEVCGGDLTAESIVTFFGNGAFKMSDAQLRKILTIAQRLAARRKAPESDGPATSTAENRKALVDAAYGKEMNEVKYLVEKRGLDPAATDDDGRSPLREAARNGHIEIVKYLLTNKNVPVDAIDPLGLTALMVAAENGQLEVVAWLVGIGASVNLRSHDGKDALAWAQDRTRVTPYSIHAGKEAIEEWFNKREKINTVITVHSIAKSSEEVELIGTNISGEEAFRFCASPLLNVVQLRSLISEEPQMMKQVGQWQLALPDGKLLEDPSGAATLSDIMDLSVNAEGS